MRRYDPAMPDNAENPNFGNFVGLAFAEGASLIVVDGDIRGMWPPTTPTSRFSSSSRRPAIAA